MSKSNAIQAQYSAEIHINVYEVEYILESLQEYYDEVIYKNTRTAIEYEQLINKFTKLYNELKGGKNESKLA